MRMLELLFVIALGLYSTAIWSHRIRKELKPWMVWLFGAGVVADISGTVFLCVAAAEKWTFTLHTVSGLTSLLIMALHFLWALMAVRAGGKWEAYFNRFSVRAWVWWLIAFLSGIPLPILVKLLVGAVIAGVYVYGCVIAWKISFRNRSHALPNSPANLIDRAYFAAVASLSWAGVLVALLTGKMLKAMGG